MMLIPDYRQLKQYLMSQQWEEADIETRRLMLLVTGVDQRRDILLTEADIRDFPCNVLQNIDHLWVQSSQGKFGFSMISALYSSVDQDYSKLSELVGWRVGSDWINANQINFSTDAKPGHLPLTWVVPTTFSIYWSSRFASAGWKRLLLRVERCNNIASSAP